MVQENALQLERVVQPSHFSKCEVAFSVFVPYTFALLELADAIVCCRLFPSTPPPFPPSLFYAGKSVYVSTVCVL